MGGGVGKLSGPDCDLSIGVDVNVGSSGRGEMISVSQGRSISLDLVPPPRQEPASQNMGVQRASNTYVVHMVSVSGAVVKC